MKRHILTGIRCGVQIWLAYGIVEFMLTCLVPMLRQQSTVLPGWQWRLVGLVFAAYALLGVVLGSVSGILLACVRRHRDSRLRIDHEFIAALTFTLAFAANLISTWPLPRSEYIALTVAVVLAAGFAGALASIVSLERMVFLANPWTVILLLLTCPWISHEVMLGYSVISKTTVSLLLIGLILAVPALRRRRQLGPIRTIGRQKVTAGTAIVLLLVEIGSGTTPTVPSPQASGLTPSSGCNVVLITMDTVRADHLSVYGYERDTTPNLRNLAREATVYSGAIATSDQTLTTHASIFTGLYPGWHRAYYASLDFPEGRPLTANSVTLAQVLRSNGFWTAAVVANYGFLDPFFGFSRGFAVYDSPRAVRVFNRGKVFYMREGVRRVLRLVMDTSRFEATTLLAADINHHALSSLDSSGTLPFFLFLNYMDAHSPYLPPPPFNSFFPGRDARFDMLDYDLAANFGLGDAVRTGKRPIRETEKAHLLSQYDGGIAYMDSQIGDLLTRLRQRGFYENTLIMVTSDHGEAFGDRKFYLGHALGSVYQDVVHVPLLIKYPGQHEARRSDALVSQVDLMPTVLDVTGIAPPPGLQGRTLRLPRSDSWREVYTEAATSPLNVKRNPAFRGVRRSIVYGSWKLIAWTEGPPELYDLATDPDEIHNLYRVDDPHAKALADRLSAWVAAAPRHFDEPSKLNNGSLEKLKSLGYAQ